MFDKSAPAIKLLTNMTSVALGRLPTSTSVSSANSPYTDCSILIIIIIIIIYLLFGNGSIG
jgi:hypothetical protein